MDGVGCINQNATHNWFLISSDIYVTFWWSSLVIINDVVGYMNQYAQPDDPEGFWLELHMTRKSPK